MTLTKCQTYLGLAGSAIVVLAALGGGAVWALDTRYITVGSFEKALQQADVRYLKRMIRKLEYLKQHGGLTAQQEWELEGLKQEVEELEQ